MSKYTSEVRFICESACNLDESVGLSKVNEIIEQARPTIFEAYPIFDETYRGVLETKILRHYYTREICAETPALWKLWLNNRLNEIMPYYNQLYKSALLEFNPLYDVDLYRDHKGTGTSTGNASRASTRNDETISHGNTASDNWDLRQDTPQGGLTGVEELEYLTEANKRTVSANTTDDATLSSEGSETSSNSITSTDNYLEHVYGKQGAGNYSKMLMEYRQTFINIDTMIINDLKDLFFNLW